MVGRWLYSIFRNWSLSVYRLHGAHNFLNGVSSLPSTLTNTDAEEIRKLESVESVTPMLETVGRIQYTKDNEEPTSVEGMLVGTSSSYQEMFHTTLKEGRFFTEEEEAKKTEWSCWGAESTHPC